MKIQTPLLSALLLLSTPALAEANKWTIDAEHSQSSFEVTHLLVSKVRGDFGKTEGTIEIDDKDLTKSKIDVTIDATTINTRNAKRDEHLKTGDFFAADKHPKITFKSTKVEKGKSKDTLKVTGDLTMKGVTKPVVLDVTYTGKETKTPWNTFVRGASATAKINRHDWGISWNKTFDGGGVTVGDEVTLLLDVEFNRPAEAAPAAKTN